MVHRPDRAHERVSRANCRELLFDEVIWVRRARQEFDAFVDLMRGHAVEVMLLRDLLAETLCRRAAREWLLSRRLRPEEVIAMFSEDLMDWMREMEPNELAGHLLGGITAAELPSEIGVAVRGAMAASEFVLAPVPNLLYTRDASAWLYGGVLIASLNPSARRKEALNVEAIYRFHPRFSDAGAPIWFGGADHDWGEAAIRGGDVMALGDGVVLVGEGEQTTAKAASILALNLFRAGQARLVIGARLAREHATMRLDTVMTFCDRDLVAVHEPVASRVVPILYRPDGHGGVAAQISERPLLEEVRDALGLTSLTVVASDGGGRATGDRPDEGNDLVALAPGEVIAYERNEAMNVKLTRAGVEVHAIAAQELGRAGRGVHSLTCPIIRER